MKCIAKNSKGKRCRNDITFKKIFYCNSHNPLNSIVYFAPNKTVGIVISLVFLMASIFFTAIFSYEAVNYYKNFRTKSFTLKNEKLFKSDSSLKILIIPFSSSFYCNDQTILCEREIKLYFDENFTSNEIETVIDTIDFNKSNINAHEYIDSLAIEKGADMVLWGDYQYKCNSDSTKIEINYKVVNKLIEPIFGQPKMGEIPRANIILDDIRKGKVMVDVDDLVNIILGWKEFKNYNLKETIYYFEKYVNSSEHASIGIFSLLGYLNLITLEYERGIHYYSEALQINPFSVVNLTERASCYKAIRKCDMALKDLNRAVDILTNEKVFPDPGKMLEYSSEIYNDRANLWISCPDYVLKNESDFYKLINDYDKAISLDSNDTLAYLNKGMLYMTIGGILWKL